MMKEYTKQDIKKHIANTFGFAILSINRIMIVWTFTLVLIATLMLIS